MREQNNRSSRTGRSLAQVVVLGITILASTGSFAADEVRGGAGGGEASAAERLFGALEGERVDSLCNRGWVEVDFGAADGADFDGMEALVIFDLPTDRVL